MMNDCSTWHFYIVKTAYTYLRFGSVVLRTNELSKVCIKKKQTNEIFTKTHSQTEIAQHECCSNIFNDCTST